MSHRRSVRSLIGLIGLFVAPVGLTAAPPTPPTPTTNEAVQERLRSLRPNQAVLLGKAAVVGEFNDVARRYELDKTGPRGRDFTIKMVWAPERGRALFCGANHGVPHRLNDVWEFDLATFSWSLLYAPDNARDYLGLGKDYSDVEFKDGVLITKRGGPAVIAHTWWGLTYDPEQKAILFMNTWVTNEKKAVELLGGDPSRLYPGPPLWAFYPESRRWKMLKTEAPYPRPIFGGLLEYVPELGGSIWHANNWQMQGTWLYQGESGWKSLRPNADLKEFAAESPQPEQVGYYDPGRRQIVAQRGLDTFHFDPKANAWRKVLAGEEASAPNGHDARSPLVHDPKSGHGLLVDFRNDTLWAYNPDKPAWTKLNPAGDPMPAGNKKLAYFDPAHQVLVVIRDTEVWAYRYQ
jgi:hypothetical protein